MKKKNLATPLKTMDKYILSLDGLFKLPKFLSTPILKVQ